MLTSDGDIEANPGPPKSCSPSANCSDAELARALFGTQEHGDDTMMGGQEESTSSNTALGMEGQFIFCRKFGGTANSGTPTQRQR